MIDIKEVLRLHKLWLDGDKRGAKADLRWADLRGANLRGALRIVRIDCGGWSICVMPDTTSIGCKTHNNQEWLDWNYDDDDIKNMAHGSSEFWQEKGDFIKSAIRYAMDCPVYKKQKDIENETNAAME